MKNKIDPTEIQQVSEILRELLTDVKIDLPAETISLLLENDLFHWRALRDIRIRRDYRRLRQQRISLYDAIDELAATHGRSDACIRKALYPTVRMHDWVVHVCKIKEPE